MTYDESNIFAKILRGEIPNDTVYEDDEVLAFRDIAPKKKVHVLVIPKTSYLSFADFAQADAAEVGAFFKKVGHVANDVLGLKDGGYRIILNTHDHGGQEVPHLHAHILGGEPVGPMVS